MSEPGRRTKYTRDVIDAVLEALSTGMNRKDSCVLAGIAEETFYKWMNGELADEAYPEALRKAARPAVPSSFPPGTSKQERSRLTAKAQAGAAEYEAARRSFAGEFSESVKKAETQNKQRSVVIVQNAAQKSWQAAAWWLERRHKDEFGQKIQQEHSGKMTIAEFLASDDAVGPKG